MDGVASDGLSKAARKRAKKRARLEGTESSKKIKSVDVKEALRFDDLFKSASSSDEVAEKLFELANASHVIFGVAKHDITIRQDPSVANTGGCVWDTAFVLARWMQPRLGDWRMSGGRLKCLEIGAGCGLLGIALGHLGCDVIVTEQSSAMSNLTHNVNANPCKKGGTVVAQQLTWGDANEIAAISGSATNINLIVGTDVIYNVEHVEPLLQTLHALSTPTTIVLLCYQQREPAATAKLLSLAPNYFTGMQTIDNVDDGEVLPFSSGNESVLLKLTSRKQRACTPSSNGGGGTSAVASPSTPPPPPPLPPSLHSEMIRREAFRNLRQSFTRQCRSIRQVKRGVLSCFTKWHFELLRLSSSAAKANGGGGGGDEAAAAVDPLLPANVTSPTDLASLSTLLKTELLVDGFSDADATRLSKWLVEEEAPKQAGKLSRRLEYLKKGSSSTPGNDKKDKEPWVDAVTLTPSTKKPGLCDVCLDASYCEGGKGVEQVTLQISEERRARLQAMCSTLYQEEEEHDQDTKASSYHAAMMCLLLRYQSLDGGGFQCAIPSHVFDVLQQEWKVKYEGFASPLNCHFGKGRYYSCFPDVDRTFGSLGSFFTSSHTEGSFELNPPFSASLYQALLDKCIHTLQAADEVSASLSYILILGATQPALQLPCIKALDTSPFLRGKLFIGVAEHVYVSGDGRSARPFRACDTGVWFLQSRKAAKKLAVTEGKLAKLRAAFESANVVPK